MSGVHERGIRSVAACAVLCCLWSSTPAGAIEFGNILFPPVQQQSRDASALALDAISMALKGIAELERDKPGSSQELLSRGAGQLKQAAGEMERILSKVDIDEAFQQYLAQEFNRNDIPVDVWDSLLGSLAKEKPPVPKTRGDLFIFFVAKTMALSDNLEKPQRRLQDIGDYLKFGELVTHLMR